MATIIGDANGNLDGTSGADVIDGLAGAAVRFATISTGLALTTGNLAII